MTMTTTTTTDATDRQEITRLIREKLEQQMGVTLRVDVGDAFWNSLIYGTLASMVERVDTSGFCMTSFGEERGIRCYGYTHYPRDTAGAALVLARCGRVDLALSILRFTMRHCPTYQMHVPHVLRRDGAIQANTVQTDTPAHVAIALRDCVLLRPDQRDTMRPIYDRLLEIILHLLERHAVPQWQLIDSGNYNEQGFGGGSEQICDLFTNAAFTAGLDALADLATVYDRPDTAQQLREHRHMLEQGIESNLFDEATGRYLIKRDVADGGKTLAAHWVSLYPQRWHAGRTEVWDRSLEALRDTIIEWDQNRVISGDAQRGNILGKFYAHLLAYLARTGRFSDLAHHMDFARDTVRRPDNLFPEFWLYRHPVEPNDYQAWFAKEFAGAWQPYVEQPDGDYTIDSGNCEQSTAFLYHVITDLIGIDLVQTGNKPLIWPKLPFAFDHVRVDGLTIATADGLIQPVGYQLQRNEGSVTVDVTGVKQPYTLRVAVPSGQTPGKVCVNDEPVQPSAPVQQNEVVWFEVDIHGTGTDRVQIT